jgi:hypothetical protein
MILAKMCRRALLFSKCSVQACAQITNFHDKEKEEWWREKWLKDDRRCQEGRGILNETALFPLSLQWRTS